MTTRKVTRMISSVAMVSLLIGLFAFVLPAPSLAAGQPLFTGNVGFLAGGVVYRAGFNVKVLDAQHTAQGWYSSRDANGDWFTVNVTCAHIMANEVHFHGLITSASDPSLVGQTFHGVLQDNGTAARSGDKIWAAIEATHTCEHNSGTMTMPAGGPHDVISGNFQIIA